MSRAVWGITLFKQVLKFLKTVLSGQVESLHASAGLGPWRKGCYQELVPCCYCLFLQLGVTLVIVVVVVDVAVIVAVVAGGLYL